MSDDAPRLSVLPPNRSLLEAGLDLAFDKLLDRIEPPFPELMDPQATPADFLPYLAADRGVSEWSAAAGDAEKRDTVARAWAIKRFSGTRRALELAIEGLQMRPQVVAWYERTPPGAPYSFEVTAWADELPYDSATDERLSRRLAAAKSERDVIAMRVGLSAQGRTYIAAGLLSGERTTIYPLQSTHLEQRSPLYVGAGLRTVEATTIYPQEA